MTDYGNKERTAIWNKQFHLGFFNVELIDMLVEVFEVDHEQNILELAPHQLPGTNPKKSFFSILAWFRDEYPKQEKGRLIINNLAAFEKLIELKIAVLYSCGGKKRLSILPFS